MPRVELSSLPDQFDTVIIGGGITGAGILREAVRTGAKVLLVEQHDYASGTSSASSKLVHGGLRYLKNGQWRLTLESVRERQRLMVEAPGLVEPQPFLMPIYRGRKPSKITMRMGLWVYDRMAGVSASRWLPPAELQRLQSHLKKTDLLGAMSYMDARTDDARLVLRLILEAVAAGGVAVNYVAAGITSHNGRVIGVQLTDAVSGQTREIHTPLVINASGAWAAGVRGAPGGGPLLRPLRGSHLVFSTDRFPLAQAVSWLHPRDDRPIFAYPWEGAVIYGTTDLDHDSSLVHPVITSGEFSYLMEGLAHQFPEIGLTRKDVVATYSGVRPVVAGGKDDPSAESRESALWSSSGLVNITGGKLTTFRVTARQVLQEAAKQLPLLQPAPEAPVFSGGIGKNRRLSGRLGVQAAVDLLERAKPQELEAVAHTPYCWAELRWAARHEQVVHLEDMLMRRTRIGLVMAGGGREILPRVGDICRDELGWDDARWAIEEARYLDDWRRCHAPPSA